MTKPGKPEDTSLEVELPEEEDKSKGVEVNIDETEQKGKKKEVTVDPEQLEKLHRRNEYLNRQIEKTTKQMEQLSEQLHQLQNRKPEVQEMPKEEEIEELDEIDKVAQKDWKKAVRMLNEQQFVELKKRDEEEKLKQQQVFLKTQQLEKSKQAVLSRYPEIENPDTEEAKLYIDVLNENPDLLSNPRGPELAMYEMEARLRTKGVTPAPVRQEVQDEASVEVQRRLRATAGAPARGRQVSDTNKVSLSSEERAHCDKFGIPYVEYAKMYKLGPQGFREGVSV